MTAHAGRHLRLVAEPEPDPGNPAVWRPGLDAARAALAVRSEPAAPDDEAAVPAASFRPLPPDVAGAWSLLRGGRDDGGQP